MGSKQLDIFPWSDSDVEDTFHESGGKSCDISMNPGPELPSPSLATETVAQHLDFRSVAETHIASKILWHCIKVVNAIREENGGASLCIFKIGLTSNPIQRRDSYMAQNFKKFVILHKVCRPELLGMVEMLEAALIAEFYDNGRCCRNKQGGGESMRRNDFMPRFPPPYYAYCAATNASQKEPVLG